jgi:energy-converting hydrogenase Eha subunit C
MFSFGIQTAHKEPVSAIISIVLIGGGMLMAIAGVRAKA